MSTTTRHCSNANAGLFVFLAIVSRTVSCIIFTLMSSPREAFSMICWTETQRLPISCIANHVFEESTDQRGSLRNVSASASKLLLFGLVVVVVVSEGFNMVASDVKRVFFAKS